MAATVTDIANWLVSTIATVPGAPAFVVWRKTEVFYPVQGTTGDPDEGVVVSGGSENTFGRALGGSTFTAYPYQIAVYARSLPAVDADDTRPAFLQACKETLSNATPGVGRVWDFEIADKAEWENQPFGDGGEVSRFGVMYRTSEPVNG